MTVNKVILVGNLGQDPELRSTAGGTPVCNLRLATTERRRDPQSGDWRDHTEWHNVVVFGRQAENVARYMRKGRQLYVEGRLQTRRWQDRNGQDRWTTEVIAERVAFLGGRGEAYGAGRGGPPPAPGEAAPPTGAGAPADGGVPYNDGSEEDIPF